ncbi:hypothetical protein EVAR_92431_1 [Eumeta japonica]|uniref:Uncharacterized protein n=1 Tax=Eumeta variegata TaxID=151549 RepID=A0A4C1T8K6_EUMVA|nr:hypothetical protein EVAR_92431_1 [Eumeta japonica]
MHENATSIRKRNGSNWLDTTGRRRLETLNVGCCPETRVDIGVPRPESRKETFQRAVRVRRDTKSRAVRSHYWSGKAPGALLQVEGHDAHRAGVRHKGRPRVRPDLSRELWPKRHR